MNLHQFTWKVNPNIVMNSWKLQNKFKGTVRNIWEICIFLLDIVFCFFLVYLFFKMKSSAHFKTLNLYGKLKEDSMWSSKLLPLRISIMRQQDRENFRNTVISGVIVHGVFLKKIENVTIWFNRIDKLMWNWSPYCMSHKYLYIKIDHSLRDLIRIKKEKNWKKSFKIWK